MIENFLLEKTFTALVLHPNHSNLLWACKVCLELLFHTQ